MNRTDPIISLNISFKWVLLLGVYLFAGFLAKNYFGLLNILLFCLFLFEKKTDYCLYLTIIWIFTSRFLFGMRYLELSGMNNQIEKIFLLILIFIHLKRNYTSFDKVFIFKMIRLHIAFFLICLISFIFFRYNFLRIIVSLNYFMLFLAIILSDYDRKTYVTLFNLVLGIGIIQVPIAAFQYFGIINTPSIVVTQGNSTIIMKQGLDDVACGTFGPMASPDLSVFLTLLTAIMLLSYLIEKKNIYLYWGFFYLLQYLVVDSKTALAISLLIYVLIIKKVYTQQNGFSISLRFNNIWLIGILILIFGLGIKNYYNSSFGNVLDFNFYTKYINKSFSIAYNNFGDWGKITGFNQVSKQQYKENNLNGILFGFGIDEYNKANRRFYLKQRVSPKMKILNYANNFLNNDSSLITIFAEIGILGLLIVLFIYFSIYDFFSKTTFNSYFAVVIQTIVKPVLIGLLIFSFLSFTLSVHSFSIIGLWLILAIALKMEDNHIKNAL